MKNKAVLSIPALCAALSLGSCETHELAPRETVKAEKTQETASFGDNLKFSYSKFGDYTEPALIDKSVGYTYLLYHNEVHQGAFYGYAVYLGPYGPPQGPFEKGSYPYRYRLDWAQLSTTITAAAMLKVIESKGGALTVDSPIAPYLPANWKLGPNVKLLTFRHLLTHVTGLAPQQLGIAEPETDLYENLRKIIANGIPATYLQDRNGVKVIVDSRKQSLNYALMRILIPYVQHGAAKYKTNEVKNTNAEATAADYVALVQQLLLAPSGIVADGGNEYTMPDVVPTGETPYARYYQFGNMNNYWEQDNQGRLYAGANRWYMDEFEYNKFLEKLWHGQLISPASLQVMKSGQMGMTFLYGKYGKYYYQKGYTIKNGAGLTTLWMAFPDGTVGTMHFNTLGSDVPNDSNGTPDLQNIFKNAYDQAWEVVQ